MKRYPWVRYLKRSQPDLPYDSPIYLGNWSNGEFFHEQTSFERKVREEILRAGDDKSRKLGMDRREFMASAMGFVTALSVIQQACSSKSGGNGGAQPNTVMPPAVSGGGTGASPASAGSMSSVPLAGSSPGMAGQMAAGGMGGADAPSTAGAMATGGMGGAPANPTANGQYCFDTDSGVDPTMCDQAARAVLAPAPFIFDGQTHCFDDAPDAAWRSNPPPGFNIGRWRLRGCIDVPVLRISEAAPSAH